MTLDVVDGRAQASAPDLSGAGRNWRLYGEANKARTRAGHQANDGTLLRRNVSEAKSISTSLPSTTRFHEGNGLNNIPAAIVIVVGPLSVRDETLFTSC